MESNTPLKTIFNQALEQEDPASLARVASSVFSQHPSQR